MKKKQWNYKNKTIEDKIIKFINKLFVINDTSNLSGQYIFMYLKHMFKLNNILLLKNNKQRNINTYIKDNYGGFIKLIDKNLKMKEYFIYNSIKKEITLV